VTPPWRQGPAQILPMGDRGVGASPGPRGEPPVPLPPQPSPTGLTDEEEVETVVVAAGGTPKTAGPAVGDPPAPTARSAQTRSRSCKIPRRDVPSRADSADARTRRAVSADARAGWHESPRPAPATPPSEGRAGEGGGAVQLRRRRGVRHRCQEGRSARGGTDGSWGSGGDSGGHGLGRRCLVCREFTVHVRFDRGCVPGR